MRRRVGQSSIEGVRDAVERELSGVVDRSAASQVLCDSGLRYLAVSEPYLVTFGLVRGEVVGLSHLDVFPTLAPR